MRGPRARRRAPVSGRWTDARAAGNRPPEGGRASAAPGVREVCRGRARSRRSPGPRGWRRPAEAAAAPSRGDPTASIRSSLAVFRCAGHETARARRRADLAGQAQPPNELDAAADSTIHRPSEAGSVTRRFIARSDEMTMRTPGWAAGRPSRDVEGEAPLSSSGALPRGAGYGAGAPPRRGPSGTPGTRERGHVPASGAFGGGGRLPSARPRTTAGAAGACPSEGAAEPVDAPGRRGRNRVPTAHGVGCRPGCPRGVRALGLPSSCGRGWPEYP
jgi:hypothetical protein